MKKLETRKDREEEKLPFSEILRLIVNNFNAALVNVTVSMPLSLGIVFIVNSRTNKDSRIEPSLAILTLIFSYFMSFLINGGTRLFKSFTVSQAFIIILQIKAYGVESLPWTCLVTSMFLVLIVMLQIQKFIKMTPKSIVCGLKFATGKYN